MDMHIAVLASVDKGRHISPNVDEHCTVIQLKEKWAEEFGVKVEDLLFRIPDGTAPDDECTVDNLLTSETPIRLTCLSVEEKVTLTFRLRPLAPSRNGLSNTESVEVNGYDSCDQTEVAVWLSEPVSQAIPQTCSCFQLDERRPVRVFANGRVLKLESSFVSQGVDKEVIMEVEEAVRDVGIQSSPSVSTASIDVRPQLEDLEIQCHRVPSMTPQPLVVDCLFPEEGWYSVDETLYPNESQRELLPKAAEQFNIPVEEATFVFQVGITFPLPDNPGRAVQVMRGSSRKYIDERGREVEEKDRICQTLSPLHEDDLPWTTPVGKPVVIIWRRTVFYELRGGGKLQPLDAGQLALDDKRFCAFYRGLRVVGQKKEVKENGVEEDVERTPTSDETTTERTFLRVTSLIYIDANTGEAFADEQQALKSCDLIMETETMKVSFFVILVPENQSFPKYQMPKNRFLAVFTRKGETLELNGKGELRRTNESTYSRTWTLPREMSQLLRDLTNYFTS